MCRAEPTRMSYLTIGRRHRPARTSVGFTVIEIIVALFVGVAVVVGARTLLEGLAAQTARVAAVARASDRDANGERLLRGLVGRLEIGTDSAQRFGGDEREVHFTSWCDVARGWQERCRVSIAVEPGSVGLAVVARLSSRDTIVLKHGRRGEGLRYLADPSFGGRWLMRWSDGLAAPLAIGILVDADTMIVRIGERG